MAPMHLEKCKIQILLVYIILCHQWLQICTEISPGCSGMSLCKCTYRDPITHQYAIITCEDLKNITALSQALHENFTNISISSLNINQGFIPVLYNNSFSNLSISKLIVAHCGVKLVEDDTLRFVSDLQRLQINGHTMISIPNTIRYQSGLNHLGIYHGLLESVKDELLNLIELQILNLKGNQLQYIQGNAFSNCLALLKIDLSTNKLVSFENNTFANLRQLTELNLAHNQLITMDGQLNHLISLQKIVLYDNKIQFLDNMSYVLNLQLKVLNAASNPLNFSTGRTFVNFPNIAYLHLMDVGMKYEDLSVLQVLVSLTNLLLLHNPIRILREFPSLGIHILDLGWCQLRHLNNSFPQRNNLEMLFLRFNYLKSIDGVFVNLTSLKYLDLAGNYIETLTTNSFKGLKSLNTLYLEENRLKVLYTDVFRAYSAHLKFIRLNRNLIQSLNGSVQTLYGLQTINLTQNLLTSLTNELYSVPLLARIDLSSNQLMTLRSAFENVPSIQEVDLHNNSLKTVIQTDFAPNRHLKYLHLNGNNWSCDCRLKWLVEEVAKRGRHFIDDIHSICHSPSWLVGTPLLQLTLSNLTQWMDCPDVCSCSCIVDLNFYDYSISNNCSNRNLTEIPTNVSVKSSELNVSSNRISSLKPLTLPIWNNLTSLDIHGNNLLVIDIDAFPSNLNSLDISFNNFVTFNESLLEPLKSLESVLLQGNPWFCECNNMYGFWKWIVANSEKILDINETLCVKSSISNLEGRPIVSLTQKELCPLAKTVFIVSFSVLGGLLFIALTSLSYMRYNRHLKVWMYARGICACLTAVHEEEADKNKRFDAFISYSSKDEDFIAQHLLPGLEDGPIKYNICLHDRHFVAGEFIQTQILTAVEMSKRTIVVLSRNFIQSEWCRMEFRSAHQKALQERMNRVIVIILGELPELHEADKDLRLYLQTNTYLKWQEPRFWDKLRYSLPRPREQITADERTALLPSIHA